MPAPAPFSTPAPQPLPYPALYLYPLNDSFVPKHIALAHGQHVKIGRQTNAKTAPGERNGYFDSKVLSRQHAEVWEEGGKIYIKDVKSSNGTFINGERLSNEAVESDPFELKSDDIVEYGIDIVGEDNKTIIHHKVAARVICVFTEQDAQVAARAEQHQQQQQQQQYQQAAASTLIGQPGPSSANATTSGFNFNNTQQRRPQLQQPNLGSLGGLSGGMRGPGKGGLSFDVILSRLQGELQKSRETGAELNTLTGAINEIHDTLSGGLPTNLPPFPSVLPPVRPAQEVSQPPPPAPTTAPPEQPPPPPSAPPTAAITELQAQLRDTQNSLAGQLDKIRALEAVLAEQETMKREVKGLREMIENRQREMEQRSSTFDQEPRGGFDLEEEDELDQHDDDDARSVNTIMPHELEPVDEEDEDEENAREAAYEQERREEEAEEAAREEHERRSSTDPGRPHTPEPIRVDLAASLRAPSPLSQSTTAPAIGAEEIHEQLVQLTAQVGAVVALTSTLEAQHTAAQSTIHALESKVETLEALLKTTQQQQQQAPPPPPLAPKEVDQRESLTDRITEWMKNVEGKWNTVQEEWNQERERLGKAREEWETKVRQVDSGLERMRAASASSSMAPYQHQQYQSVGNGDVVKHNGLVTPPSPRSQSSDSARYRRRRRKGGAVRGRSGSVEEGDTSSSSRSRSHSREGAPIPAVRGGGEEEGEAADVDLSSSSLSNSNSSPAPTSASSSLGVATGGAAAVMASGGAAAVSRARGVPQQVSLATPESSIYKPSSPGSEVLEGVDDGEKRERTLLDKGVGSEPVLLSDRERNMVNVQAAVGVLLLSVAAAAVIWKVKPE